MLEREIKSFILKAMLAAGDEPVTDGFIKSAVSTAFRHVAFTAADLNGHVKACEELGFIAGTTDDIAGVCWSLTTKGKIRAQQIR